MLRLLLLLLLLLLRLLPPLWLALLAQPVASPRHGGARGVGASQSQPAGHQVEQHHRGNPCQPAVHGVLQRHACTSAAAVLCEQ